ncbi:hypothetical protein Q5752_001182 [Cryptotrichosporon argae]
MLLYHGTPTTYPSYDGQRLLAIRFAQPVAVDDVVVHPPGVACPSGVSQTSDTSFDADVLLNIVDATPINALARTALHVGPSRHALRFKLNMSGRGDDGQLSASVKDVDVGGGRDAAESSAASGSAVGEIARTRLFILRSPAERITLSLYGIAGHAGEQDGLDDARKAQTTASQPPRQTAETLDLPDAAALIPLIIDQDARPRVALALSILARGSLTLEALLALDLSPLQQLADDEAGRIIGELLGVTAPTYNLPALVSTRDWAASASVAVQTPLHATTSHAYTLLILAQSLGASPHPNAPANTAYLVRLLAPLAAEPFGAHLARALPPLAVSARVRGAHVDLVLPTSQAKAVVAALVRASMEVIDGKSAREAATELAQPYLAHLSPSDPLVLALQPVRADKSSPPQPLTAVQSQFAAGLASPSSSALHVVRPADVLAVLAPSLLASLSTAPVPALGIEPTRTSRQGAQASDWGGKVYSRDEFRRDRDGRPGHAPGLGLGAAGVPALAVLAEATVAQYGQPQRPDQTRQFGQYAASIGLGIASGYGAAGRKASRHVDDFVG